MPTVCPHCHCDVSSAETGDGLVDAMNCPECGETLAAQAEPEVTDNALQRAGQEEVAAEKAPVTGVVEWNEATQTVGPRKTVAIAKRGLEGTVDCGESIENQPAGGEAASGERVPPGYEYLRDLGEGGFGVVVLARDEALGRLVALKFLKAAEGSAHSHRFEAEARVLAQFQNPNVLQIHDFGRWNGLLYLALEYVEGGTLVERLDGTPLTEKQASQLVETLARAVGEVHAHGVVHRDLKPANVLIVEDHTTPVVDCTMKIADFGLAKVAALDSEMTHAGMVMGTPSYMAPEQASGRAIDATPETDVYSLGVMLYEMLTGRRPFRAATPFETCHQVIHDDPVRPKQLLPKLSIDLETICLKCLEKDPRKRYENAAELAADLERFNEGHPIKARKTSPFERGVRLCRRNPLTSSLVGALLAGMIAGVAIFAMLWQSSQKRNNGLRRLLYSAEAREHTTALQDGDIDSVTKWLDEPTVKSEDLRGFEWKLLDSARRQLKGSVTYNDLRSNAIAYSPTDDIVVCVGVDGGLLVMRASDYKILGRYFQKNEDGFAPDLSDACFFPDGKTLAIAGFQTAVESGQRRQSTTVRLIDTTTWEERRRWELGKAAGEISVSHDGRYLATASADGPVQVWDVETNEDVAAKWPPETHEIAKSSVMADFDSDRNLLAVSCQSADKRHLAVLIDVETGRIERQFVHQQLVLAVQFSPAGRSLATTTEDEFAHVWNVGTGDELAAFGGHDPYVFDVEFSRDGRLLYTSGLTDNTIRIWRLADRVLLKELRGPSGRLELSRNGEILACSDDRGGIRFWDSDPRVDRIDFGFNDDHWSERFVRVWSVPTQASQILGVRDNQLMMWSTDDGRVSQAIDVGAEKISNVAISAAAGRVAFQLPEHRVGIWEEARGRTATIENTAEIFGISGDGSTLLLGPVGSGQAIEFRDAKTNKPLLSTKFEQEVHGVACSYDGRVAAAVLRDGTLLRWRLDPLEELPPLKLAGRASYVRGHEFVVSRDGAMIAAVNTHSNVELWDFERGERLFTINEFLHVWSLDFSSDNRTLAVGLRQGKVSLWNLVTQRRVGVLEGGKEDIRIVRFTKNDESLIAIDFGGRARIWRADAKGGRARIWRADAKGGR